MSEERTIDERASIALARSWVYAMLAQPFRYPTPQFYTQIDSGPYAYALTEAIAALYPDLEDQMSDLAVTLCAANSLSDQEADYLRIFETEIPNPPVSLYEGMSAKAAERADILLELKAFFTQFGLTMNKDSGEIEDNLTAELEFMQFLAAKEAEAICGGRDPGPYQLAQHDFLSRHLGKWLPNLANSASRVTSGFYRSAAQIAALFVERDSAAVVSHLPGQAASGSQTLPLTTSTEVYHEIPNARN